MKKIFLSVVVLGAILFSPNVFSQNEVESTTLQQSTIFEVLTNNSDSKKGLIVINQDDRIYNLVCKKNTDFNVPKVSAQGYRVQVFSSNEVHTSKSKAYAIEEKIKTRFPNLTVYVNYISPFWKVRVGDCPSNEEAQYLRNDIRKEFPEYQQETYVVRDQILVPEY